MRSLPAQEGFSLIELMIAITLGLLVLAGASSFFASSKQGFRAQDSNGRMQEGSRFGMNYLSQILRLGDFWGGIDAALITIGSHSIKAPAGAQTCNSAWIAKVTDGVQGYEGGATAPIDCISANDYVAHSDLIAVRYADPNGFTSIENIRDKANAKRNYIRTRAGADGYLYEGQDHAEAEKYIANGDGVLDYEYDFQLLFLRPCSAKEGRTCSVRDDNGKPIPTLVSLQLQSDGGVTQVALVDNVEQMQFEYGVDSDGDRVVDTYQKADAVSDWKKVLSIRASIIVRGDALEHFTDTKTYYMTSGFCYGPKSSACSAKYTGYEHYQRRLIVKDIQIRNRIRQ